jgi:group I intron endonuclease
MSIKNWPGEVCSVYSITNKLDGMRYIGVAKNTEARFKEHSRPREKYVSYINRAINAHGRENFEFQVLLVSDRTYCLDMEAKLVNAYDCLVPNGYNLCAGGRGRIQFHKGINHPQYGKRPPQEVIEKVRQAITGKKLGPLDQEHKDKIGEAVKTHWADPEQRAKKLAGMQKAHDANRGRKRPLSEEGKQSHVARMKAQWADPVWRAKVIEARPKPSEESRMKQSEFMKKLWAERKAKEVQSWE